MNQPTKLSTNQSSKQSSNQLTNPRTAQHIHPPSQPTNQPTNQPTKPTYQPLTCSTQLCWRAPLPCFTQWRAPHNDVEWRDPHNDVEWPAFMSWSWSSVAVGVRGAVFTSCSLTAKTQCQRQRSQAPSFATRWGWLLYDLVVAELGCRCRLLSCFASSVCGSTCLLPLVGALSSQRPVSVVVQSNLF